MIETGVVGRSRLLGVRARNVGKEQTRLELFRDFALFTASFGAFALACFVPFVASLDRSLIAAPRDETAGTTPIGLVVGALRGRWLIRLPRICVIACAVAISRPGRIAGIICGIIGGIILLSEIAAG